MSVKLVLAAFVVLVCACVPCQPIDRSHPQEVCHPADAGSVMAGAPFVLEATTVVLDPSCAVTVDGGLVDLFISGSGNCPAGSGFAKPASRPVRCEVPALPEGSYTVNTLTPLSFTLPDAGIPACP